MCLDLKRSRQKKDKVHFALTDSPSGERASVDTQKPVVQKPVSLQ